MASQTSPLYPSISMARRIGWSTLFVMWCTSLKIGEQDTCEDLCFSAMANTYCFVHNMLKANSKTISKARFVNSYTHPMTRIHGIQKHVNIIQNIMWKPSIHINFTLFYFFFQIVFIILVHFGAPRALWARSRGPGPDPALQLRAQGALEALGAPECAFFF